MYCTQFWLFDLVMMISIMIAMITVNVILLIVLTVAVYFIVISSIIIIVVIMIIIIIKIPATLSSVHHTSLL